MAPNALPASLSTVMFASKSAAPSAGELSLSVIAPEELTGTLVVELFVQGSTSDQYQRVKSFSVNAANASDVLLDNYLITNNFYVRVGVQDNGKGKHLTDYTLNMAFTTFDDSPLDADEWLISAGKETIQIDGWVGYRNSMDTYHLTVNSGCAGWYNFQLIGDPGEATLNIRSISGKLIKSAVLDADGTAVISGINLYSDDYLVEIDFRNGVWSENNTRYTMTVSQNEAFEIISATESAEVNTAEQGEKLFFALDIQESGRYDVSELQNAGLTVWFQKANSNGSLGPAKLRPDWVDLQWDVPSYMTLCNNSSAWGDSIISLDSENHKFVLLAASSIG